MRPAKSCTRPFCSDIWGGDSCDGDGCDYGDRYCGDDAGSSDGGGEKDFDDDGAGVMVVWVVLVSLRIVLPCVDLLPRDCTVLGTLCHLI